MNSPEKFPDYTRRLSISGDELHGERLVRKIYLDESGNSGTHKVCVVAGLVLHVDTQWRPAVRKFEDLLADMPDEYRIQKDGTPFVFRTYMMLAKSSYPNWNVEKRREIVHKVMAIPTELNIPIAIGAVKKDGVKRATGRAVEKMSYEEECQYLCFALAVNRADDFLGKSAKGELGELTADDHEGLGKRMNSLITRMKTLPMHIGELREGQIAREERLGVHNIIDEITFVKKTRYVQPLQIVDAVAYGLRTFYEGGDFADVCMKSICTIPGYPLSAEDLDPMRLHEGIFATVLAYGPPHGLPG
jgi:hypothetical protein